MKIIKISNIYPKAIQIEFEEGGWARLYKFGNVVYSEVSDRIKKSTLVNIKKDAQLVNWDSKELEKLYL